MARPRELLSLANIADETGISYATLRNYALKFAEEIPSEGSGRSTRYPRSAVKVFQRLRKESKPGRKPRSLLLEQGPAVSASPAPAPARAEMPREIPRETSRPAASDPQGIERELAAIRVFLGSIAQSLERLAQEPRAANTPAAPAQAPVEEAPAARAAVETAAEPEKPARAGERLPVPPASREVTDFRDPGMSHRRLHSLPKVMGQRGRRPE
jgi:hypothetical protein